MTRRSLRFRLLVAAIVSVVVSLLVAGLSIIALFERHVERRIELELEAYLNQITAGVGITPDNRIAFSQALADARFNQPLGGFYWQIQDKGRPTLLRSRSLWDFVIELPKDELELGTVHEHELPGPNEQLLLVQERQVIFKPGNKDRRLRIAVAIEKRNLIEARNAFATDIVPYFIVIAIVLLLAAWLQVRIGLGPLDKIRRGVMDIRSGAKQRLERKFPDEVMPLVDEINELLEGQEKAIDRARTWTADLAHGLKTPLSVLTADSELLRQQGNTVVADNLDQLAETMRRRVDRELIRARVRSGVQFNQARADVRDAVNRIVRTLKRTPDGAELQWSIDLTDDLTAAILPEDLTELLGNILENASKWATKLVTVSGSTGKDIVITIEDDGTGVTEDQMSNLGLRGIRLDEQKRGTGLGLAIARDTVEAYGGSLSFDHSPKGGLAVTVKVPSSE